MNNLNPSVPGIATVLGLFLFFLAGATATNAASNKNVWIWDPVDTKQSVQDWTICVGDWYIFGAETSHPSGGTWDWSVPSPASKGAVENNYPYSSAWIDFPAAGGPINITATYTKGDTEETSHAARVRILGVASANANDGTEVDDGDGNANTKMYVVCKGSGSVSVTATCTPTMTEQQLQGTCWSTAGGDGTALLTRTVSKATCGDTIITFAAGTSSRSVRVSVVEVASAGIPQGQGWEIDDLDGNPNTKSFFVCPGDGSVTVSATPCANVSEAQLANSVPRRFRWNRGASGRQDDREIR